MEVRTIMPSKCKYRNMEIKIMKIKNPITCPNCNADLVHDFNNVFNRCLNCGWYEKRVKNDE